MKRNLMSNPMLQSPRQATVHTDLFDTVELGEYRLANRVVMAPLTRSRASAQGVPTSMMAEYYAQRASAGLIIAFVPRPPPSPRSDFSLVLPHERLQPKRFLRLSRSTFKPRATPSSLASMVLKSTPPMAT